MSEPILNFIYFPKIFEQFKIRVKYEFKIITFKVKKRKAQKVSLLKQI